MTLKILKPHVVTTEVWTVGPEASYTNACKLEQGWAFWEDLGE